MWDIFKENNEYSEQSIIGFIAFLIMCVIMVADLVSGWVGKDLVINEFVYDSFVWVVLGCFGIAGVEKFSKKQINGYTIINTKTQYQRNYNSK